MEQKDLKNIKLTVSQQKVLDSILNFVEKSEDRAFILKGYAGTGKTTLMRFLIAELEARFLSYKLLASTGRAAKILSDMSEKDTSTIHSMVYTFKGFNKEFGDKEEVVVDSTGQLFLMFEGGKVEQDEEASTVYIIDEASMVSDKESKDITQAKFGSGRLLKELLDYDQRKDTKFIFVGDPCQLPPIDEYYSPALMENYFEDILGVKAQEGVLTEIMRQEGGNDLISASKVVRKLYNSAPADSKVYGKQNLWAKLPFNNYRNIIMHPSVENMVDEYVEKINKNGLNSAVFICRSNRDCYKLSAQIRQKLGFTPNVVCKGDLLMVIQNNMATGLMNGDLVKVTNISDKVIIRADLKFRQVTVKELFTGVEYTSLMIEDVLHLLRLNLDNHQQQSLFVDFIMRMKKRGITAKTDKYLFYECMRNDPYLNALRCSFGYAITCHKSQGGEWKDVYVHVPRNIMLNPTKGTYQWIYTAMTRAVDKLHMVYDFYIGLRK